MINIEQIKFEINNLKDEIYKLTTIKDRLETIVRDEESKLYENFIPMIDNVLDKELDKEGQNKLWNDLHKHKISIVLNHLTDIYSYRYIKCDDWNKLIITRKIK